MNLDIILDEAIAESCREQDLGSAATAIKMFVAHYLSNEIPDVELSSKLQDIYQLIRE